MDKEKQRIKIAEACGWTHVEKEEGGAIYGCPAIKPMFDSCRLFAIPDYLNDLNAMHKAESTMGDPQLWMEYEDNLAKVMNHVGWVWHATAAQRAEAFLKTLNLWEE